MLKILSFIKPIAFTFAFLYVEIAMSEEITEPLNSAGASIESQFDQWMTQGLAGGAMKTTPAGIDNARVEISEHVYEIVKASRSFSMLTSYPLLLGGYDAWPALEEINNAANTSCSEMNGTLKWVSPGKGVGFRHAKIKSRLLGDAVYKSKYFGVFTCIDQFQSKLFEIQVEPIGQEKQLLVPPANTLLVNVYLIDKQKFFERQQEITNFRSNIKIGDRFSVSEIDVPKNALPGVLKTSLYRQDKVMLCGLVTGIQGELLQVQMDYGTFFLPTEKAFPPREQVKPNKATPMFGSCL